VFGFVVVLMTKTDPVPLVDAPFPFSKSIAASFELMVPVEVAYSTEKAIGDAPALFFDAALCGVICAYAGGG
jgi:hypothetical protein